jgi:hypothetical protein
MLKEEIPKAGLFCFLGSTVSLPYLEEIYLG